MRTCEACGREFTLVHRDPTCPYCGYNTDPRSPLPRSKASLARMEQDRQEQEERERELNEYLGAATD